MTSAPSLRALSDEISALDGEIRARDLVLAPQLQVGVSRIWDRRQAQAFNYRIEQSLLTARLDKLFVTGTTLSTIFEADRFELRGTSREDESLDWEVRLTQSLWRDGFGRGTRLRQKAEQAELQARRYQLRHQLAQQQLQLEHLYWDYYLVHEEENIRARNLERGKLIESWVRQRQARSAAENADLLQAQALRLRQELELITTQDRKQIVWQRLAARFPSLSASAPLSPTAEAGVISGLDPKTLPESAQRLDRLAGQYLSEQLAFTAEHVADTQRADFSFFVRHGRNAISPADRVVWNDFLTEQFTFNEIGLTWSTPIDFSLRRGREASERARAVAQKLRAEDLTRQSDFEWQDLRRSLKVLAERSAAAERLAAVELQKANAERQRYRQGRSTAFQAISFEQGAAEAQLLKTQTLVDLRKRQAELRLFEVTE